jgi:cysteine desulfurase/selenocysteine lyase
MAHYLDYAATSAIRPQSVGDAVARFLHECGGTPGRGAHAPALEAGRVALRARRAAQALLGVPGDPGRLAFTCNATTALNTALLGLLRGGDVLVVSQYDHNSVLRPAAYLGSRRGVEVRMLAGTPDGEIDYQGAEALLEGATLLTVNSASNVLGNRLPLAALAERAHAAGALVLLDAAQGAGHIPMRCAEEGADLVAFTGHKGMLGPQGTGGLWVREGLDVEPLVRGGAGGDSRLRSMPEAMPDRLEAGTMNAPGLAGLEAGIAEVMSRGVAVLHAEEARLKARLREGLASVSGVRVLSPSAPDGVGIVTFQLVGIDPGEVARRLETEHGVQGRSGLHCAPECHRLLGSEDTGAVRLSVGWASTDEDVEAAVEGVAALASAAGAPRVQGFELGQRA